ncbi:MAG: hypothetical protein ACRDTU_19005 [Micromonosporaceae bacterium]
MVPREPSDNPTEEFVPDFDVRPSSPPVASKLRASEAFVRRPDSKDVGVSLFDRRDDADDAERTVQIDVPGEGEEHTDREQAPDRRRYALITSLVAIAAVAGVLAGYVAVQAAGGWDSIWVTSHDGPGMPPEPDSTRPGDDGLGQDGSASPSASASGSVTPSASDGASGTPGRDHEPGGTPPSDPDPTKPTRTPPSTPTPSDSPSDPEPSESKPHDE